MVDGMVVVVVVVVVVGGSGWYSKVSFGRAGGLLLVCDIFLLLSLSLSLSLPPSLYSFSSFFSHLTAA